MVSEKDAAVKSNDAPRNLGHRDLTACSIAYLRERLAGYKVPGGFSSSMRFRSRKARTG
jgi:hypothetical protein